MITDTSTMIDNPVSGPSAVIGDCCVINVLDFPVGLDTPPRVGSDSSVSVFSGLYCL